MSNSPLVQYTRWSPNHSGKRTKPISKITIHHTAGVVSVETLGSIFAPTSRQASSTYGVGYDGRIGQYVDEGNRPWTSGSEWNDQQAVTIEVSNSAVGGQWPVSDLCIQRTIELCIDIVRRNPTIKKVDYTGDANGTFTLHNMFQSTNCPGPYLQSKIPYIVKAVADGAKPKDYSKTSIMGKAEVSARQMAKFLLDRNPQPRLLEKDVIKFCQFYLDEGAKEGIRGDIAFCQSLHETGWFRYGGLVLPEQNNFAGIGATNNSAVGKGAWFDTPQLGVRAQMHHLKAYASKDEIKNPLSPRYHIVKQVHGLGSAPYWEELSGKWAVPGYAKSKFNSLLDALVAGETYGHSILKLYDELKKVKVDEYVKVGTVTTTAGSLTVRAEASSQSEKIGTLNKGVTLDYTKKLDGWFEVIFENRLAYVSSLFAETDEEIAEIRAWAIEKGFDKYGWDEKVSKHELARWLKGME